MKTTRSCPRHLLYLETGMIPSRFLGLLQYILQQPDDSLMNRVYQAQLKCPTKGDWASETAKIADNFEIQLNN